MADNPRVAQLEHTLLELGTEIYRLKHEMTSVSDFREEFAKTMKGLRQILDDKGVITAEDFDTAIEFMEQLNNPPQVADFHSDLLEVERSKKVSH